jgi:protein SPT2
LLNVSLSLTSCLEYEQINKPIKQVSSHASLQDNRPKKKPVRPFPDAGSDDEDAFSMLRKLIG